jgi:glycosyltransferase involved in cell wall biosynthesis
MLESSPLIHEILLVEAEDDPIGNARPLMPTLKACILSASRGRARQMNAGAAAATAPIILFLHADCRLGPEAIEEIGHRLTGPGPAGVAFRLAFRESVPILRIMAWCSRLLGGFHPFAFGDQGLAVRRDAFHFHGGFPDVPIFEDVLMVRALRRDGGFRLLRSECATSGRRFLDNGCLRQILQNAWMLYRFGAGEDLGSLAEEYRRGRGK